MMRLSSGGFTLVEVLVALVVMSLGVMMLANSIGGSAKAYSRIDDKVRAWMVASDKLVELQVYQEYPPVGTNDSTEERFGETWAVRTRVSNGPYPDTRRVDIEVGPEAGFGEEGRIDWTQSSLIGKPQAAVQGSGAQDQDSSPSGAPGDMPGGGS